MYERAVRLAASLGWHFHHEDVEVSFVAPGLEPTEDVFAFLRYLALVEPQEATPVFSRLRASEDYNLIVTARAAAEMPAALAARSYVISLAAVPKRLVLVWGRGFAALPAEAVQPAHNFIFFFPPADFRHILRRGSRYKTVLLPSFKTI